MSKDTIEVSWPELQALRFLEKIQEYRKESLISLEGWCILDAFRGIGE